VAVRWVPVRRWALVVAWMALVFRVSSISDLGRAARVPDWISHPIEYGVGAVLVCRALEAGRGRPLTLSTVLTATLLVTAYGVTDEYHQSFVPGRTADPMDVMKDLFGSSAASALYRRWTRREAAGPSEPVR
jgi:VanZ family protein